MTPAATQALPSPALSTLGGGLHVLDPKPEESQMPKSLNPVFILDLAIQRPEGASVGERVYVRFYHSDEPLVYRLLRGLRRLFLDAFAL